MLKIYLTGLLVTFLTCMLTEHLYFGAGSASSVRKKDIFEDLLLSLLSWIGMLLMLIFYISEIICRFSSYGSGKALEDFEDELVNAIEGSDDSDPYEQP